MSLRREGHPAGPTVPGSNQMSNASSHRNSIEPGLELGEVVLLSTVIYSSQCLYSSLLCAVQHKQ